MAVGFFPPKLQYKYIFFSVNAFTAVGSKYIGVEDVVLDTEHVIVLWLRKDLGFFSSFYELKGQERCFV